MHGDAKGDGARAVKGMLFTSQETLFFALSRADASSKPVVHSYGKHSLAIFPQTGCEDSSINQRELGLLLRALWTFAHYEDV